MKRGFIMLAALCMLTATSGTAQKKKSSNVLDVQQSITDNSIVYPESFETDTQKLLEGWYMKNYVATDDRYRTAADANVSDEVIIERLKNIPSVIEMPFNQVVRKYIDRYAKNGRTLVTACLGLGNYYLPIIEQALEAEGLPNELKYVPMIESAFNPNAVSRAGATGLWQFMLSAAKGYDMEVSSLVDERRDPYESSKKGAKLLKDLYNTYGRWDLAIAAYNCGPGNVNKAIRRAGGDPKKHDFWSIYNYLPAETRGYFPMFVAANYIMNYYPDHNISPVVPTKPLVTDTVGVTSRINLNQISKVLDIPLDELRLLNPQYRNDVIPGTSQRPYMLILPSRQIAAYIMSEEEIKGYKATEYGRRVVADPGTLRKDEDIDIEVAGEDDLLVAQAQEPASTSEEESQTDEDYRMVREASRKKQEDDRRRAAEAEAAQRGTNTVSAQNTASNVFTNNAGQTIHKVVAGEDLTSIARQHQVSVDQLKIWNNLSRQSVRVGQQLVIKGGSATAANNNSASRQTENYDEAPAQPAATAKPAATANRRTSRAQATQANNAQANNNQQNNNNKQSAQNAQQNSNSKQNNKQTAQQNNNKQNNKQTAQQNNSKQNNKQTAQQNNTKQNNKQTAQQNNKQNSKQNNKQTAQQNNNNKQNNKQTAQQNNSKQNNKQTAKKAEPAKPTTHEVKDGESLEKIAKKNGVTVDELRKANKHVKGDMIHPGDKMTIPAKKNNAADSKKNDNGKKQNADSKNTQTQKGAANKNNNTSSNNKSTNKKKK